jgi:hypothetical protein
MTFVATSPRETRLKVSWVSLESAPPGVIDVRAVALTAMSVKAKTRGMAKMPAAMLMSKSR